MRKIPQIVKDIVSDVFAPPVSSIFPPRKRKLFSFPVLLSEVRIKRYLTSRN